MRLALGLGVTNQEVDRIAAPADLGKLAGKGLGDSIAIAQRVGQIERATGMFARAALRGELIEEAAVLVEHAGAGELRAREHQAHHHRRGELVEQLGEIDATDVRPSRRITEGEC
jgi:hypothetical protein